MNKYSNSEGHRTKRLKKLYTPSQLLYFSVNRIKPTHTALILPVTAVFSTIQTTIFVRGNRPGRNKTAKYYYPKKLATTIPLNIQTVLRKPPRGSYHLPNMPSKTVLTNQWRPTNPRPLNFSCPCRWSTDLPPVSWDNYIMIMNSHA